MQKYLIGIDEAGRGPLAGPVSVAAVAVLSAKQFRNIKDSKKLSAKQREEWFEKITSAKNVKVAQSFASHPSIDKHGIIKTVQSALNRCLKKLEKNFGITSKNCFVKLDGSLKAPAQYRQETIIRGDDLVPVISAASIVAKVRRDRHMLRLHKKLPCYCFDRHKGYGTALHYRKIKENGISEAHRKSFLRGLKAGQ